MLNALFSLLALLAIQLGFAGGLGAWLYRLRTLPTYPVQVVGLVAGFLIYLPASIALPFSFGWQVFIWSLGTTCLIAFTIRPVSLPAWIWRPDFAWKYTGITMGMILLWSLSQPTTAPGLLLGSLAALAGVLAWKRSDVSIT